METDEEGEIADDLSDISDEDLDSEVNSNHVLRLKKDRLQLLGDSQAVVGGGGASSSSSSEHPTGSGKVGQAVREVSAGIPGPNSDSAPSLNPSKKKCQGSSSENGLDRGYFLDEEQHRMGDPDQAVEDKQQQDQADGPGSSSSNLEDDEDMDEDILYLRLVALRSLAPEFPIEGIEGFEEDPLVKRADDDDDIVEDEDSSSSDGSSDVVFIGEQRFDKGDPTTKQSMMDEMEILLQEADEAAQLMASSSTSSVLLPAGPLADFSPAMTATDSRIDDDDDVSRFLRRLKRKAASSKEEAATSPPQVYSPSHSPLIPLEIVPDSSPSPPPPNGDEDDDLSTPSLSPMSDIQSPPPHSLLPNCKDGPAATAGSKPFNSGQEVFGVMDMDLSSGGEEDNSPAAADDESDSNSRFLQQDPYQHNKPYHHHHPFSQLPSSNVSGFPCPTRYFRPGSPPRMRDVLSFKSDDERYTAFLQAVSAPPRNAWNAAWRSLKSGPEEVRKPRDVVPCYQSRVVVVGGSNRRRKRKTSRSGDDLLKAKRKTIRTFDLEEESKVEEKNSPKVGDCSGVDNKKSNESDEDEDEDAIRASLLSDLSRRKKIGGGPSSSAPEPPPDGGDVPKLQRVQAQVQGGKLEGKTGRGSQRGSKKTSSNAVVLSGAREPPGGDNQEILKLNNISTRLKHFPNLKKSVVVPLHRSADSSDEEDEDEEERLPASTGGPDPESQDDDVQQLPPDTMPKINGVVPANFALELDRLMKDARNHHHHKAKATPPPKPVRKNPPKVGHSDLGQVTAARLQQRLKVTKSPQQQPKKVGGLPPIQLSQAAKNSLMTASIGNLPAEKQAEYLRLKALIARKEQAKSRQKNLPDLPGSRAAEGEVKESEDSLRAQLLLDMITRRKKQKSPPETCSHVNNGGASNKKVSRPAATLDVQVNSQSCQEDSAAKLVLKEKQLGCLNDDIVMELSKFSARQSLILRERDQRRTAVKVLRSLMTQVIETKLLIRKKSEMLRQLRTISLASQAQIKEKRVAMAKLRVECQRMGLKVKGVDYRLPSLVLDNGTAANPAVVVSKGAAGKGHSEEEDAGKTTKKPPAKVTFAATAIAHLRPPTSDSSCSNVRRPTIDPHKELCRFELQGKCNDDSCQFQHHVLKGP